MIKRTVRGFWTRWLTAAIFGAKMGLRSSIRSLLHGWTVTRSELAPYLSDQLPSANEMVTVRYPSPQRAELDVTVDSPGIVILSDIYYPGWELTIDDKPAPIYPTNQLMRGAAVDSGNHKLVYSYRPRSFRLGCIISVAGAIAMVLFGLVCIPAR